jgi:hypothetical protein
MALAHPLKSNRQVSMDRSDNRAIREIFIPAQGRLVHLKGYGWVKVFRTVGTNGDAEYWATSRLDMTIKEADFCALDTWQIEVYHRVSNSSSMSNLLSADWKSRSAIVLAWLFGPSFTWRLTVCILASLGLKPEQALFDRRCVSIWLIQLSHFSQLRKS